MGGRGAPVLPVAVFGTIFLTLVACTRPPVGAPTGSALENGATEKSTSAPGSSTEDATVDAEREDTLRQPATPTMSPLVRRMASGCSGWRVGSEIEPGRLISARYDDGSWIVEVEGAWEFHGVINATPEGLPTADRWQGAELVIRCTREIDAVSGQVGEQSSVIVTTTPPTP